MSKRGRNILLCLLFLALGGVCYVLFRTDSHIAKYFDGVSCVLFLRKYAARCTCGFFRFYLPDLLWGLSFGLGLTAIFEPKGRGILICAGAAFVFGCIWELLQFCKIISGTGDWLDVTMYLAASFLCLIFNKKRGK